MKKSKAVIGQKGAAKRHPAGSKGKKAEACLPAGRSTFAEVCQALCKPFPYLRQLQTKLSLHVPDDHTEGYTDAYIAFLNTVVVLRTFGVSAEDISDLFEAEKKLLKLLKVDTLTNSRTWYLEFCGPVLDGRNRLLLTNYDLSRSVTPSAVQFHLDFGPRDQELFSGVEMGEDVRHVLKLYRSMLARIKDRVRSEEPVLKEALTWAASVFP
jgi:hypothetical protein